MKIEINLQRENRKEAFKKIDMAVNQGATIEDLDALIGNILFQRGRNEKSMHSALHASQVFVSKADYAAMGDANAIIAHCEKLKVLLQEHNEKNKTSFIDLEKIELTEKTIPTYILTIRNAILTRQFGKIELQDIIIDLKTQMHKLSSLDKTYYDRIKVAKEIIDYCKQQLKIFEDMSSPFFNAANGPKRK